MRYFMKKYVVLSAVLSVLGGCGLVDSRNLSTDYSFDAQHFTSPTWGDDQSPATVPSVPCNLCAAGAFGDSGLQAICETTSNSCIAMAEIRLSETVDLSKQTS